MCSPNASRTAKKKSEKGGSSPITEKSWNVATSPSYRGLAPGRISSWSPPMNSLLSFWRIAAILSSLTNALGSYKACVTLGGGGSVWAGPAAALFFPPVCFFGARFARLGAMGEGRGADLRCATKGEDEVLSGGSSGSLCLGGVTATVPWNHGL